MPTMQTTCRYDGDRSHVYKFTGKERDTESGLDYFGARYDASNLGRYMTPDPLMASGHASDPQTWNRYTYALDNPLRFVDPDGMEVPESCAKDPKCTIVVKVNVIYDQKLKQPLTAEQKKGFESQQIEKAKKDFGVSNIRLDVTYTPGSWTWTESRQLAVEGARADALNVLATTETPTGDAGVSYTSRTGDVAFSYVSVNDAETTNRWPLWMNTTEHEIGHNFLGHTYLPEPGLFEHFWRDVFEVEPALLKQSAGRPAQEFRTGLEKRRYAVPLNPEANKPRQ